MNPVESGNCGGLQFWPRRRAADTRGGLMITLYGFKSCDTVGKARAWLDARDIKFRFFDYRVEKLDPKVVDGWFARAGWEKVFNRNSTAFKELPEAEQAGIDENRARAMILAETN